MGANYHYDRKPCYLGGYPYSKVPENTDYSKSGRL